jgi:Kef-type K+ transport system membrane component KefB
MKIVKSVVILCIALFVGGCIVKALQLDGIPRSAVYFICGIISGELSK